MGSVFVLSYVGGGHVLYSRPLCTFGRFNVLDLHYLTPRFCSNLSTSCWHLLAPPARGTDQAATAEKAPEKAKMVVPKVTKTEAPGTKPGTENVLLVDTSSFLLLVVRPGAPSSVLVAMPGAPRSFFLLEEMASNLIAMAST